jgi:hypothetical protein
MRAQKTDFSFVDNNYVDNVGMCIDVDVCTVR